MFGSISKYSRVYVTGPQRAGTTICAKMIAHDTGLHFFPEGAVAAGSKHFETRGALQLLAKHHENFVVQCPIQCRFVHTFSADDSLVVMMFRPLPQIKESEERIGWGDSWQRLLYEDVIREYRLQGAHIAVVKYAYWRRFQRDEITNWHEQRYEYLSDHLLWVPKEERRKDSTWGPRAIGLRGKFSEEVEIESVV